MRQSQPQSSQPIKRGSREAVRTKNTSKYSSDQRIKRDFLKVTRPPEPPLQSQQVPQQSLPQQQSLSLQPQQQSLSSPQQQSLSSHVSTLELNPHKTSHIPKPQQRYHQSPRVQKTVSNSISRSNQRVVSRSPPIRRFMKKIIVRKPQRQARYV